MAKNTKVSYASLQAAIDAELNRCDSGFIRIYDGAQPANADTAVGGQTLLAELALDPISFDPAVIVAGTQVEAYLNLPAEDPSINATGTATWARFVTSGGVACFDCSVGGTLEGDLPANFDMMISSKNLVLGGQIQMGQFKFVRAL